MAENLGLNKRGRLRWIMLLGILMSTFMLNIFDAEHAKMKMIVAG